jgi:isoleucyl-tRNA synthetase
MTKWLDLYQIDKAVRPLMGFVDDLSTWYTRRSRDRFKSENNNDKTAALQTMRYILREFAKVAAPTLPFYAEHLFCRVKGPTDSQSVHLESWPRYEAADTTCLRDMTEVRRLVTLGLEQRAKVNLKVRQPLASLSIKSTSLGLEFLDLIKDEVNVKEVVVSPALVSDVLLDTVVTESLRKEGIVRDLIRAIQELRKTEGLTVGDKVTLLLESDEKAKELVQAFIHDIKKVTLVTGVDYAPLPHAAELVIEEYRFKLGFKQSR